MPTLARAGTSTTSSAKRFALKAESVFLSLCTTDYCTSMSMNEARLARVSTPHNNYTMLYGAYYCTSAARRTDVDRSRHEHMAITLSIDNAEHSVRSPACNAMQCNASSELTNAWHGGGTVGYGTAGRPRRIPGRCSPVKSKHHQRRCVEKTQASSVRVRSSIELSSELLRSRFRGQKNK